MSTEEPKNDDSNGTKAAVETEDEIAQNVTERLKFFFSDANLRSDRWLRFELQKEEAGGYISLETLLRFKTIRQHTTETSVLQSVIEKSPKLKDQLVLSEDRTKVKRREPFTKDKMNDNIKLSLRVDNLPLDPQLDTSEKHTATTAESKDANAAEEEEKKDSEEKEEKKEEPDVEMKDANDKGDSGKKIAQRYAVTHEEVKALFEQFGTVALVRLQYEKKYKRDDHSKNSNNNFRRVPFVNGRPLGAAFVEFEKQEDLEKAAAVLIPPKPEGEEEAAAPPATPSTVLCMRGNTLRIERMETWIEAKEKEDEKSGKKKRKWNNDNGDDDNNNGEKKKKQEEEEAPPPVQFDEYKLEWKKGRVVRLEGLSDSTDREAIMDDVTKVLELGDKPNYKELGIYVDYSRGQTDGAVRFSSEDSVPWKEEHMTKLVKAWTSLGGETSKVTVKTARVLEGEEEEEYYRKFIEFKNRQRKERAEEHAAKKRRTSGGGGRGRGRKGGHSKR